MAQPLLYVSVRTGTAAGMEMAMKRTSKNLILNWNPAIAQTAVWIFLFFGVTLGSLLLVA